MAKTKKTVALEHLQKMVLKCAQEIGLLAGLVADALETEFTVASIPITAWKANTDTEKMAAGLEYMADVPVEGAEEKDSVDAVLKVGSMTAASACGMSNVATVVPGAVRFFAVATPEAAITVQVRIVQGK